MFLERETNQPVIGGNKDQRGSIAGKMIAQPKSAGELNGIESPNGVTSNEPVGKVNHRLRVRNQEVFLMGMGGVGLQEKREILGGELSRPMASVKSGSNFERSKESLIKETIRLA